MSADLTAAGDQVGCSWARRAAAPATCGAAMDVPLKISKVSPGRAAPTGVGVSAARMSTPGAVMSGLGMSGTGDWGPREEKEAITSAGRAAGLLPPILTSAAAPSASSALTA